MGNIRKYGDEMTVSKKHFPIVPKPTYMYVYFCNIRLSWASISKNDVVKLRAHTHLISVAMFL